MSEWRGVGVALPVFSIRSKDGLGVGEFLDLKLVVDWAEKTGQSIFVKRWGYQEREREGGERRVELRGDKMWKIDNEDIIQILPINDTTVFKDFRDSYPYR